MIMYMRDGNENERLSTLKITYGSKRYIVGANPMDQLQFALNELETRLENVTDGLEKSMAALDKAIERKNECSIFLYNCREALKITDIGALIVARDKLREEYLQSKSVI